jgi:glycosyltransferase involved in cell wall biosynthesis
MSHTRTVSVCLPVYNGERFLAEAIRSVLEQTYTDFELLIIDDCSTDSSPEIIKQFTSLDKRVRYLKNEQNLGLFENYNECMKQASGRYIKLFAQDDVFHPSILEKMVGVFESKPEVALVTCAKEWVGESGEEIRPTTQKALRTLKPFDQDRQRPAKEAILESFQHLVNWLGEPCTSMFRNSDKGSGFDVRFKQVGDLEYWYRILQNGDYYFLAEDLCKFRKHSASTTNRNGRSLSALLDWFVLGNKYRHLISEINETEDEFCQRLTRRLIKSVSTRFGALPDNVKLDPAVVLKQLTDFESVLSCFATAPGTIRDFEAEYKVFAICALRAGAGLHNEIRITQSQVELQQEEIARLQSELADVRLAFGNEIEELQNKLSALGNSLSWKVTAPLRSFNRLLR